MPNIPISMLTPPFPLHWTSILHYILLLGTLAVLVTSGDKTSILFIILLGVLALIIGADLYLTRIYMPRIFVFLIRVVMVGLPAILAGMSPSEQTRALSGIMALVASPILVLTFFTCNLGPVFGDPRIINWCP